MASADKKEIQMKEQIAMYLRKKDYYDILGVPKAAQSAQIKKAYKKLALRFHPDKNNVQGSKQVFKKVSNAYSNLIDAEKRATYDRFGPDEDRQPQYRPQRQYRQGYSQQDQFQDIFRAFFGGVPAQNRYRNGGFQHFTFNMGGPRQQNQGNQGNQGFSFLYILAFFFVLYILPAFFSSSQESLFSLSPTTDYRFKQETSLLRNTFYVKQQYLKKNKSQQYVNKIEASVDYEYVAKYKKQCDMLSAGYYSMNASTKTKWQQSCTKFRQFNRNYPGYVRKLLYGY